jgi:hypothetical protein
VLWAVSFTVSALVVLAVAVPGAMAQASLEPVQLWGPADGPGPWEPVAAAGGGQTAIAWSVSESGGYSSSIFLSRRGDGGAWGAPEAVSRDDGATQNGGPGGQSGKQGLAVDAHGNALLAWEGENSTGSHLFVDEVPDGGPARPAVDLWHDVGTINGIEQVTVSFDAGGDATVMWRAGSGLYLVRRPAGGTFGSPVRIADEKEIETLNWPSFASGANGDAVAAGNWDYGGVAAWVVPRGSGPGGMQVLQKPEGSGSYSGSVRVAMAPNGEAIAAWYTEERNSETDGWLTVATRAPGASSFSAPKNIDRVPNLEGLALAVSPSGEASLLYNKIDELVEVSRAPGGEWRAPEELGLWASENPAAAYDPAGDLYVAWHHYESNTNENAYYAATRPGGGAFDGHPHQISGPIEGIGWPPVLAASNAGAFATWALYDAGRLEVAGPFQAPWQNEAGPPTEPTKTPEAGPPPTEPTRTPVASPPPSAPTSASDDEPLSHPATGEQPAPAMSAPPSGVSAANALQQSALGSELNTMLKSVSRRLHQLADHDVGFQAPSAGVLTIRIARAEEKRGLDARSSSLLLGRWALPRAGHADLRLAPGRTLAALAAKTKLLLTATFQPTHGTATTVRLDIIG